MQFRTCPYFCYIVILELRDIIYSETIDGIVWRGKRMRTYTVVVADDDPIIRMDMSMILENAGYTVKGEASDGIEAVKMCEQYHPDIILLDIKMPLFDGINAAKEIHGRDLCSCTYCRRTISAFTRCYQLAYPVCIYCNSCTYVICMRT